MAFETCEDAYEVNVRILELRYSPYYIAIDHPECTDYAVVHEVVLRGINRAMEKA